MAGTAGTLRRPAAPVLLLFLRLLFGAAMSDILTIIGASVRAAVASAQRCGFATVAGDLFADVDLRRLCPTTLVRDYPAGLAAVCGGSQAGEWLYTGSLENHPHLVADLATSRPLLGNGSQTLIAVRDPERVAAAFAGRGLKCPAISSAREALPDDRHWLRKPLRSGGGMDVHHWPPHAEANDATANSPGPWYFQEFIPGEPYSAVYLAAGGEAVLLGCSQQLIGTSWLGSRDFRYAGSVGPCRLTGDIRRQFEQLGRALAEDFQLSGLFGIDAVLGDGTVWPVEINPRYTASVEVLELATGWPLVAWHVEACRQQRLPPEARREVPSTTQVCAKGILFAPHALDVSGTLSEHWLATTGGGSPRFADVPAAGTPIPRGGPVVTMLCEAQETGDAALRQLQIAAEAETKSACCTNAPRPPLSYPPVYLAIDSPRRSHRSRHPPPPRSPQRRSRHRRPDPRCQDANCGRPRPADNP